MKKILISMLALLCLTTACSKAENKPTPEPSSNPVISVVDLPVTQAPIAQPEFETTWALTSTDGYGILERTFSNIKIIMNSPGTEIFGVQTYHEGLPLIHGVTYHLSFDLSATIERPVEVFIMNVDDSAIEFTQMLTATENGTHYEFDIKIQGNTSWNGRLAFNTGAPTPETAYDYHEVTISNLILQEASDGPTEPNIKINQTGYLPNAQKKVVFPFDQGDYFQVIDANTNTVVYTAPILRKLYNESTKETTFYGDFSDFTTPGRYRLQSQLNGTSYEFEIQEDLYHNLLDQTVKMLSLQRCGQTLTADWAGAFAHEQCHTQIATIYGTDQQLDVSGGWHDAGDYGRYVPTGTKAVIDLMLAYQMNPHLFTDAIGIPESGNGVADILDEARVELEWLLKMQNGWGGVYDKVVTAQFPDFIMPDQDQAPLYIMQEMTTSTGDFVGAMALAYSIYQDIDPEFAQRCLDAAKLSWDYLQSATLSVYTNPEGFSAGQYSDDNDTDERYLASAALYAATGEQKYLDSVKTIFQASTDQLTGVQWKTMGSYGTYLMLKLSDVQNVDSAFYQQLLSKLINDAEQVLNATSNDGYFVSLYSAYAWGSNADIANNGLILALANDIHANVNYVNSAADHLHYLLGRNSLNLSFVTNSGIHSPQHLHHRPASAANALLPGALVGGPDSALEDPVTQSMFNGDTAPAKCYVDDAESYSTNEVAIYWNSPLVALISAVENAN